MWIQESFVLLRYAETAGWDEKYRLGLEAGQKYMPGRLSKNIAISTVYGIILTAARV